MAGDKSKTKAQLIAELEEMRQQLNEQAEQARRERAVEQIRAEAMAMLSSDNLHNVVAVLWRQMLALGIETPGCNVLFLNEETGYTHNYFTIEPHINS